MFWWRLLFFHLIYYILTERLFGATPGKLLTESRVTTPEGTEPATSAILVRTISRFIPFEAFSFFGEQGWHDRWSGTTVVNERRTGIQGNYYLLAIPAAIVVVVLFNMALSGVGSFINHSREQSYNGKETAKMEKLLNNLSVNNYIEISDVDGSHGPLHIAVKKVNGNRITLSLIPSPLSHRFTQAYAEAVIKSGGPAVEEPVTFTREKLYISLNPGKESGRPGFRFSGRGYWVTKIVTLYQTNIEVAGGHSYGNGVFTTEIKNIGWRAVISDIKVLKGDVKMNNGTFQIAPYEKDYYDSSLGHITGKSTDGNTDFKFEFTATDSLDRRQVYRVSGNSGNEVRELEQVNP